MITSEAQSDALSLLDELLDCPGSLGCGLMPPPSGAGASESAWPEAADESDEFDEELEAFAAEALSLARGFFTPFGFGVAFALALGGAAAALEAEARRARAFGCAPASGKVPSR